MRYYILFTILFLAITGCKKEEQPAEKKDQFNYSFDSSDIKANPIDVGSVSMDTLEYRFVKGNTYLYRLSKIQEDIQTIEAGKKDSGKATQTVIYIIEVKADNVDTDYTAELSVTVKSIKIDGQVADKKIAYRSGQPMDSATAKQNVSYEALIDNTFGVRVSKLGEILDVFRAEKIVNKLLTLSHSIDSVNANDKKLLQQDIIESGLRPMLAQIIPHLGDTGPTLNKEWSYKVPGPNLGLFAFENTQSFKLAGFLKEDTKEFALVEGTISSRLIKNPEADKMKVQFGKNSVNGTGKFYYNLSSGVLQKQKTRIVSVVDIAAPVPTAQGLRTVKRYQINTTINLTELL